jgi:hypothetical protein
VNNSELTICRNAKEGDSQIGKEFWRQDESLKIERLVKDPATMFHNMT